MNSPRGLSSAGERFWAFLHDQMPIVGNAPHNNPRSELLSTYRRELRDVSLSPNSKSMEEDHGYIQWIFPLPTMGVNPRAPILSARDYEILREIPEVKTKMEEHFYLFTSFMGLTYDSEIGSFLKVRASQWNSWLENDHNYLRISRVLESMTRLGLKDQAEKLLEFLQKESTRTESETVSGEAFLPFNEDTRDSCESYWRNKVKVSARELL